MCVFYCVGVLRASLDVVIVADTLGLRLYTCFLQVEDWRENRNEGDEQKEETEPYEVERIATILCVTCMFLSALYTIFAILLFLYFGSEESTSNLEDNVVVGTGPKPLGSVANDGRRESFITMGEAT